MPKKGLKFKKGALEELRNDHRARAFALKKAEELAAAAGGEEMGYKVTDRVLQDPRAAASVMATGKARFHNRKHHSLIRSLDTVKEV
jgi:hypothetical protein